MTIRVVAIAVMHGRRLVGEGASEGRAGVELGTELSGWRGAGQGHGQRHGESPELRRAPWPPLRRGFSRQGVPPSAPAIFMDGAASTRYEGGTVDGVSGGGKKALNNEESKVES